MYAFIYYFFNDFKFIFLHALIVQSIKNEMSKGGGLDQTSKIGQKSSNISETTPCRLGRYPHPSTERSSAANF